MRSRGLRLVALVVLLGILGSVAIVLRPSTSPALQPVLVFPDSYVFPSPPISLFARLVPPTPAWAWLWHLKETLFGKIKPLNINTDLIGLSPSVTLDLGRPEFEGSGSLDASGLRVWFLSTSDLEVLRQQLKANPGATLFNSPRVTTGDSIGASLYVGSTVVLNGITNDTGIRVSYLPKVHPNVIDLSASFVLSDAVTNQAGQAILQTNLDVRGRFQIPKGKGMFLLQSFPRQTNQNPTAVILSTKF